MLIDTQSDFAAGWRCAISRNGEHSMMIGTTLGLDTIRGKLKWIRRQFSQHALILLYHRIDDADCDPWQLSVTPEHFEQHLEVLRARLRVMPFCDLPEALRRGELRKGAAVITFDDGYADNLVTAKPLLAKYELPATVFVTTGAIASGQEFWWDELARVLLTPGTLPDTLCLIDDGSAHQWPLGQDSCYSMAQFEDHRHWRGWKSGPTLRHSAYRAIWEWMRSMDERRRNAVRGQLRHWGVGAQPRSPSRRPLTSEELVRLPERGLVDIGNHTLTHPQLSKLRLSEQQEEVLRSQRDLESLLARPVTIFTYPYGDFTPETMDVVRRAGITAAGTTTRALVRKNTDPLCLPRVHVPNIDGERFATFLQEHLL
jgi:peptidoglycan/xylan/chitin deacetylase (PgdA/CDA1 family)